MAIKYSLTARSADPGNKSAEKKVYPAAQYNDLVDIFQFARHIQEHGSPFTRDVIVGVLTAAVDCLREQLLMGNKVNFGELGAFSITLRSEGAASAESFDPRVHIKSVESTWEPSIYFKDLKGDPGIRYEYTLTRRDMADAKKEAKEETDESLGSGSGSGDPDSPVTPPLE